MSHREVSDRGFESQDSITSSQLSDADSGYLKRGKNEPKKRSYTTDTGVPRKYKRSTASSKKGPMLADNHSTIDFRRHGMESAWSEGELYHSRSLVFTHQLNELSRPSSSVSKSPSNSPLHYARNTNASNSRPPLAYRGMNLSARPLPLVGSPTLFSPTIPGFFCKHQCHCESQKNLNRTDSILSLPEDPETPEGLSWRRLHMSRAKLKATATTSELLSGFAMVAMVELQVNQPTGVPEWLFVTFAVCTTILVSVHIFALMISTYLLPSIDAVSKLHVSSLVTESPHDRMKVFIELAWAFSTILGLLLFLVEIAILCWVKFWDHSFTAAMSATMIVIPILIIFVAFAMHFYHTLVVNKCKMSVSNIQELENIKKQLDFVA